MPQASTSVSELAFPQTVAQTETASRLAASGRRIVSLASGDPDQPTPPHVVEAAIRALRDGQTHYPPTRGTGPLREAIAAKLARENGVRVGTDQVLVTPGAKSALFSAVRALVNPGDEVLLLDPSWVSYAPLVAIAGARPVRVQLDPRRGYEIDRDTLESFVGPRTKAMILNSPCNPTGRVATAAELEAIGTLAVDRDLWILSDEIYEHFVFDGAIHRSLAAQPEYAPRVIVINGFSKTYAMTGWRLGWLAGPVDVVELATRVHAQTVTAAATVTMAAGMAALTGPQNFVSDAVTLYRQRRELLLRIWSSTGTVECPPCEGTFYLFPHVPRGGGSDWEVAALLLRDHGIACVAGSAFGASGAGRLRVSLTAPLEDLRLAGTVIASAFAATGA